MYTLATMAQTMSVTAARKNFLKLVDQVDEEYTRIDLTKNGKLKASLVSPDYIESLEETLYTLEHSMDDIREAKKEIAAGHYVTLEELVEEINAGRKSLHRQ